MTTRTTETRRMAMAPNGLAACGVPATVERRLVLVDEPPRRLDLHVIRPPHDTDHVGLNPFRQHRSSPADIALVVGALLVCVALVAWALFA